MASLPVTPPTISATAIRNLLLATDFSPPSERALQQARVICGIANAKLHIVHVLPSGTASPESDFRVRQFDSGRKHAEDQIRQIENSGTLAGVEHDVVLERGEVWPVLAKIIASQKIDLVLLGTSGRGGIGKFVMGSVAEKVFRLARCPVLTVGPRVQASMSEAMLGRILLATDFSAGSMHALPYALWFAEHFKAKLILLHVLDPYQSGWYGPGENVGAETRERLRKLVPQTHEYAFEFKVAVGPPGAVIVEVANGKKVNLVVMGVRATQSVTMSTHLPWSTAHHVVDHVQCPLLTVRG